MEFSIYILIRVYSIHFILHKMSNGIQDQLDTVERESYIEVA